VHHAEQPSFRQLNDGWNAEPNAPAPVVERSGPDLLLRFTLNAFKFTQFAEEEVGILRFVDCARHRLGATNDEGWYRGQCRFSRYAPAWGEFYEIGGVVSSLGEPDDWIVSGPDKASCRHFLFYFRDETFECFAVDWLFEVDPHNALFRHFSRRCC
jgi:hypothetical protein